MQEDGSLIPCGDSEEQNHINQALAESWTEDNALSEGRPALVLGFPVIGAGFEDMIFSTANISWHL